MADKDTDLMAEFQEFLNAKKEQEKEATESEDFEVEIWDKDGRGVRTRRSHARPFLQSLGIDLDSDDSSDNSDKDANNDNKSRPRQAKSTSATGQSITRKYFTKPTK